MAGKAKDPTDQEIIEILARRHHITMLPAGGNTFTVFATAVTGQKLSVEVSVRVSAHILHDEAQEFQERAAECIADPDRGEWVDGCDIHVRDPGYSSKRTRACKKAVIGVVVFRRPGPQARNQDNPTFRYTFRCATHMNNTTMDESAVVYRARMKEAIDAARVKRKDAIELRKRFEAMSEEEKIAEEMRLAGRVNEANELLRQIPGHSYRCAKMRASADDPGKYGRHGHPDEECTCDQRERLAAWRAGHLPLAAAESEPVIEKMSLTKAEFVGIPTMPVGTVTRITRDGETSIITHHADHVVVVTTPTEPTEHPNPTEQTHV